MRAFLASGREGNEFDPVAEAAGYELAADEARAIWRRVQREGRDDATARRRFDQEARAAAKSVPPRSVVGRRTLVDAEAEARKAVPRTPGRYSLTSFEARQEPVAIQRKAESGVVDAKAADLVAAARMGGVPLDRALRARLEAALGAELGAVRVHTDEGAALAARALGARAFAIGEDLFFARGGYDPRSTAGQRLIAHEVAHVVQSRSATASRVEGLAISEPGDAHEHEADDFAERFVRSGPAAQLDRARVSAVETMAGPAARRAPMATTAALGTVPPAFGTAPLPLRSRPGPVLSRAAEAAPGPGARSVAASKAAAKPTVVPSPAPPPNKQRAPAPPAPKSSAADAATTPAPAPATRRPSTKPVPGPAPATPHPTPAAPGVTAPTTAAAPGAVANAAVTATGNFAAQIRAVAARHKQELTAKASTVKAELAAAIVAEKAKLIVGFVHTLAKMQTDRDQARSDVHTHAETSRTHVRTAAKQEHTRLDQALVRQQQAARKTGDTIAANAVTQATQQGDRVHQGSQQRAAKARAVGDRWAGQFATLEGGGADAGGDVRAKAAELATKLLEGADEARQTCVDHGTKFAEDLRKDAADTASGMPDKLADSRTHIDKNQTDALASIDDGVKNAHDGITQSFDQSRQQVLDKQNGATQVYDQLAQGIGQQFEQGSQQLAAKLDPAAEDIANHAEQAEREGQQYAVSPEVTATIHTRIAGVVNDRLGTLSSASSQAQGALDAARTQGQQGAQQQTQSVIGHPANRDSLPWLDRAGCCLPMIGGSGMNQDSRGDLELRLSSHCKWMKTLGREGERLSIEGANLRGIDWSGRELGEMWLPRAQLDGSRLVRTDLYRCVLTGARLDHADLTEAILVKADLDNVRAVAACLRGARLVRTSLDGADLREAQLRDVDATAADFSDADLRGADLRGSNLERSNLTGARLNGARLSGIKGLDSAIVEWIDTGAEDSRRLEGEAAAAWLLQQKDREDAT